MDNELKDIVYKLEGYTDNPGWRITKAERHENGSWTIEIQRETKKEATNDNN